MREGKAGEGSVFRLLSHGGRTLRESGGFSPTQEGGMADVQCVDGEEDHAVHIV